MAELVEVVWKDAWQDQDNFQTAHGVALTHGPMMINTLGWLIKDDLIGVSIANEKSIQDDGEVVYRGRSFIPKEMVVSVTPFRLVKPRKPKSKPPTEQSLETTNPA